MARRAAGRNADGGRPAASGQGAARPPGSRVDYVYEVLRAEILDGRLPPGAAVPQEEVATRLGVSITPVREALRRLESAGLITYQTHFGATVTELSRVAADEFYLLRAAVEGLGARLAARRIADPQLAALRAIHEDMTRAHQRGLVPEMAEGSRHFHAVIAEAGGPALIAAHLRWMWDSYPVPQSESIWHHDDLAAEALAEHAELIRVLAAGDEEAARSTMERHIEGVAAKRRSHG